MQAEELVKQRQAWDTPGFLDTHWRADAGLGVPDASAQHARTGHGAASQRNASLS